MKKMTQNVVVAVLSQQDGKIEKRSVNEKWNLSVYKMELLLTALTRSSARIN